jgi:Sec-independent protein translocase protein TatA
LLVFGPSRLPELGRGLGQAIRAAKGGLSQLVGTSFSAFVRKQPVSQNTIAKFGKIWNEREPELRPAADPHG